MMRLFFLILENSLAKRSQRRRHNLEHVYFFLSPSFFPAVSPAPALNWMRVFQNRESVINNRNSPWRKWYLHPQRYSSCPAGDILQLLLLLLQSRAPTRNQASEPATILVLKERAAQSIFWHPTLKAANFMTSAMIKPFSKSVWIRPAAYDQININAKQEKRKTRIYLGCGASFLDRPCFHLWKHTFRDQKS